MKPILITATHGSSAPPADLGGTGTGRVATFTEDLDGDATEGVFIAGGTGFPAERALAENVRPHRMREPLGRAFRRAARRAALGATNRVPHLPGAALLALGLAAALPVGAQQSREERVVFAPGEISAIVEGGITGDETVEYLLAARQGQYGNISMAADNASARFDILPPGGDAAIFTGSVAGNQFEGIMPASGEYRVRVHLMDDVARRGETARYRLEMIVDGTGGTGAAPDAVPASPDQGGPRHWQVTDIVGALNLREGPSTSAPVLATYDPGTVLDNLGCRLSEGRAWCDVQQLGGGPRGYVAAEYLELVVGPDGAVATGPDDSAARAGRGEFDATGTIPCAQDAGQPTMPCAFGVARATGGGATLVVTRPDGSARALYFANGVAIGAGTSEADPGAFSAAREADLTLIRVGGERYEIPDAAIVGG